MCGIKKIRFAKEQEAKELLSNLVIKTPLSKILFLNGFFFFFSDCIKMNEIVKKCLLAGDKFMQEMHLKQPGFTYSGWCPLTKKKNGIETFMQKGNKDFIYKNHLEKACFERDKAYGKSKDLAKRTESDKYLRDKAFKITNDPKYDSFNGLQVF